MTTATKKDISKKNEKICTFGEIKNDISRR
jgi:hypothetical protein